MRTIRRFCAACVLSLGLLTAAPAQAGLVATRDATAAPAVTLLARGDAGLPAASAGLRVGTAVACDGCDYAPTAERPVQRSGAALWVNLAIVSLGGLWLLLVVRRSYPRTGLNSLSGAPQPAAGGR